MFTTQIEVKAHVKFKVPVERTEFERRLKLQFSADAISYSGGNPVGSYIISPGSLPLDFAQHIAHEMLEPGESANIELYEVELEPVQDRRLTALGPVYRHENEAE